MRKSLLAPQWWDAGKEHSSIDISSESEAKVLCVICRSVRYYCCGTTSFSLKNRLKSDNWSPIDNYQILHVSPFSSVFSQHEETGKVITSLVLFHFWAILLHFWAVLFHFWVRFPVNPTPTRGKKKNQILGWKATEKGTSLTLNPNSSIFR